MTFAGINYLAILIAAVLGWLAGALWYGVLGKQWVEAQGAHHGGVQGATGRGWSAGLAGQLPFILALARQSGDGVGAGRHGRAHG